MAKLVSTHTITNDFDCYCLRVYSDRWHWSGANGRMGRLYDIRGHLYHRGTVTVTFDDESYGSVKSIHTSGTPDDLVLSGLSYSQLAAFLTQPSSLLELAENARCVSCEFHLVKGTRPAYIHQSLASLLECQGWGVFSEPSVIDEMYRIPA